MQLFYTQDYNQGTFSLTDEEHRHCAKALRKKAGDHIIATDGKGLKIEGVITEVQRNQTLLTELKSELIAPRKSKIHIAIAPTKNGSRYEWFLEKATEIGLDYVHPIFCRYSERKNLKLERGHKIVLSAMKQSQQFYQPQISDPCSFKELITQQFEEINKYIAFVDFNTKPLQDLHKAPGDTLVLIGPEGGFSQEELDLAVANGYQQVALGKTRLRTETAGIAACHIINLLNA